MHCWYWEENCRERRPVFPWWNIHWKPLRPETQQRSFKRTEELNHAVLQGAFSCIVLRNEGGNTGHDNKNKRATIQATRHRKAQGAPFRTPQEQRQASVLTACPVLSSGAWVRGSPLSSARGALPPHAQFHSPTQFLTDKQPTLFSAEQPPAVVRAAGSAHRALTLCAPQQQGLRGAVNTASTWRVAALLQTAVPRGSSSREPPDPGVS